MTCCESLSDPIILWRRAINGTPLSRVSMPCRARPPPPPTGGPQPRCIRGVAAPRGAPTLAARRAAVGVDVAPCVQAGRALRRPSAVPGGKAPPGAGQHARSWAGTTGPAHALGTRGKQGDEIGMPSTTYPARCRLVLGGHAVQQRAPPHQHHCIHEHDGAPETAPTRPIPMPAAAPRCRSRVPPARAGRPRRS